MYEKIKPQKLLGKGICDEEIQKWGQIDRFDPFRPWPFFP